MQPLTGLSVFALLDEAPLAVGAPALPAAPLPAPSVELPPLPEPNGGVLTEALVAALSGPDAQVPLTVFSEDLALEPPTLELTPLSPTRLAEPFEALRDRSDAVVAATGSRPAVSLLCLASLAEHAARVTFVTNLLASGGLACQMGEGRVTILCGTGAAYAAEGAARIAKLKAAGRAVWVAGRSSEALQQADGFLYEGCDAIAALQAIWEAL